MKFEWGFQLQLIEGINAIESVKHSFIQEPIRPAHKCRRCVSKQALKRIVNSSSSGGGGQVDRVRCPSLRLYNQGPLSAQPVPSPRVWFMQTSAEHNQPTNRLRPPSPPEDKKPEKLVFANLVFSKCHQPKQKGPNFILTNQLLTKPTGYKHHIS